MYTTSTVAYKAKAGKAEVRHFARKHNLPKITIGNKTIFIFDKKDFRLFLLYKNKLRKKNTSIQFEFDFNYSKLTIETKKTLLQKKQIKKEKQLAKRLLKLLKPAGAKGISRMAIEKKLKIDSKTLDNILMKISKLPIGEDDRLDDKIYWLGD